jgi:uncharacterized protein
MQTPWGKCEVADSHVHFFSRKFFESLARESGKSLEEVASSLKWQLAAEDPGELAAVWARELDRHGVSRAALIASVPGDEGSVASAMAAFPGRFYGFFMLNPLEDGAAARIQAAFSNGLGAVCLFPAMHRYSMHDPRVQTALDAASQLPGCAVFVHCGVLSVGARKKLGLSSPFDMRFSNPIDLHPIALRYPGVRFIVPHFGAGYLREALMLADLCPNVFLDTSSSNQWMRYHPEAIDLSAVFRRALDVAGAARLLFGTDSSFFPRGWHREIFEQQARILADLGVSDGDAKLILGENLIQLFRRS